MTLKRAHRHPPGARCCLWILEQLTYEAGKGHGKADGLEGDPGCWETCYQSSQLLVCSFRCDLNFWIPRVLLFILMATTLVGLLPTYAWATRVDPCLTSLTRPALFLLNYFLYLWSIFSKPHFQHVWSCLLEVPASSSCLTIFECFH